MARREGWRVVVFCLCGLCAVEQNSHASPGLSSSAGESEPLLSRVEVALLGDAEQDPLLFERIRSLFSEQTAVVRRDAPRIDQRAVLLPQRSDTVYVWIRVSKGTTARVYLAISEEGGQARYLFREIGLDAGLDEVGGETLAEVAHSSAQALWLRELQTPRQTLVAALEREEQVEAPRATPLVVAAAPISPASAREAPELLPATPRRVGASPIRLALGASDAAHASGGEGWLHEPGAFLAFEYRARLSLRMVGRYLIPTELELPPARAELRGGSGELRAGWLLGDARRMRVRLEAGLGIFWGSVQASIVVDEPKAHALAAQNFERIYTLAAAFLEWPLGPAWIAGGADLRVPLQSTSYEVGGQSGARVSPALCPGGSLELGIGFDPIGG